MQTSHPSERNRLRESFREFMFTLLACLIVPAIAALVAGLFYVGFSLALPLEASFDQCASQCWSEAPRPLPDNTGWGVLSVSPCECGPIHDPRSAR